MKLKQLILVTALLATSGYSFSDIVVGMGYLNISGENRTEGKDVKGQLEAVIASLNYQFYVGDSMSISPGVQYGGGLKTGNADFGSSDFDVELESLLAITLRGQYDFKNRIYMFVEPTYVQVEYRASIFIAEEGRRFTSIKLDESTLSFTTGLGYGFSNKTSTEVMLGRFDRVNLIQVGLKYDL